MAHYKEFNLRAHSGLCADHIRIECRRYRHPSVRWTVYRLCGFSGRQLRCQQFMNRQNVRDYLEAELSF